MKKYIRSEYEVYSSLSYGDEDIKRYVIKEGIKQFGNAFHPITDYMSRRDYLDYLNSMDILVMYHNRQQAFGNIMTAIVLGMPVFMKTISPVYAMAKQVGISSVYGVGELVNIDIRNAIARTKSDRDINSSIVASIFLEETRLEYLRQML